MTIPPAFLEELRARIPLSDIVGRRIRLQRAGREWKAPCPFHAEKTPSFYVNDQKSFFHCFGCGAHGDAVGFLMRQDGLAFPEAVEQLAALAGMEMPRTEPEERQAYDRLKRLGEALEAAAKWFEAQLRQPVGRQALAYLQGRGLDDRTIAEFRLGYAPPGGEAIRNALLAQNFSDPELEEVGLTRRPDDGRAPYGFFRNRVIFPVADKRGRVVAFGGRILDGDGPKYVNSPEHALFHKGTLLYGLARARALIAKGARPVVVEGYMDVIAMQQAGFGGAVAPLGTALTEAQLQELWKSQPDAEALETPPVLCFDGDPAGRRAAARAIARVLPLLGPSRTVSVAFIPQGDDPDSLIRRSGGAELQMILDGALPLIDAVWQFTLADRPLDTPEQKARAAADLDAQIAAIADRSVRSFYQSEIRSRIGAMFFRGGGRRPSGRRPPSTQLHLSQPFAGRRDKSLVARTLIAAMINHPFLFHEASEEFVEFEVPPGLEPLRQAVFDTLAAEPLDAATLKSHLLSTGLGAALDQVLGQATLLHARFVEPGASEDRVRAGWRDVMKMAHRKMLGHEIAAARSSVDRGDDQALQRLTALGGRRAGFVDGEPEAVGASADLRDAKGLTDLLREADRMLNEPVGRSRGDDSPSTVEDPLA